MGAYDDFTFNWYQFMSDGTIRQVAGPSNPYASGSGDAGAREAEKVRAPAAMGSGEVPGDGGVGTTPAEILAAMGELSCGAKIIKRGEKIFLSRDGKEAEVMISGIEYLQYSGKAAMIDLLDARIRRAEAELASGWTKTIWGGLEKAPLPTLAGIFATEEVTVSLTPDCECGAGRPPHSSWCPAVTTNRKKTIGGTLHRWGNPRGARTQKCTRCEVETSWDGVNWAPLPPTNCPGRKPGT